MMWSYKRIISFFCSFTVVFNLTCFCKVLTFFLCMQSTQELLCSGVKLREEVTAERCVSLISVVQLIFADVEATGEVKGVVHARGGAAVETLDAVALVPLFWESSLFPFLTLSLPATARVSVISVLFSLRGFSEETWAVIAALPARTFGSFLIFACSWSILENLEKGGNAPPLLSE